MATRKEEFIIGEIYHIVLRGIEGRVIFVNDDDRWRGIFSLYEFNSTESIIIRRQREKRKQFKEKVRRCLVSAELVVAEQEDQRDKLVEIMEFVFMPNHIHLLLRQLKPDGISIFMQKFGSGYANYFNRKYQRMGHLFQGKFKESHISGDEYLKTVSVYIHTNPISIMEPGWKESGIKNPSKVIEFLEGYRWLSYLDYLEKKNFPSITERDFLHNVFGSTKKIKEFVDARVYCSKT
jgi:REP element-mobilizing transposase RayT